MAIELLLAVTDADGSPLNLLDRTNFRTQRAGVQFTRSADGQSVSFPILCLGPTPAVNWSKIAQKLYTYAPLGCGPWGVTTQGVVLKAKFAGESNYSYYDICAGEFDPTDAYQVGSIMAAKAVLHCLPWVRGAATTYAGLVPATGGGAVWLGSIPGDLPAIARVRAIDTSYASKNAVRIRYGQHTHPALAQADIAPFLTPSAASPGATFADATAYGGTSARLNPCTATFQNVAIAFGPNSGMFNRRARILAKVKSSVSPVGQPTNFAVSSSAGAGNIGTETITACVVPYDGSAPYVSGVNNLGTPSALITKSTTLLVAGGTQQVALNPLFYDDFELNSLVRWFPGLGTIIGGSSNVFTSTLAKDTGTYGLRLSATSPAAGAGSLGQAPIVQTSPALPTSKKLSAHMRLKVTTETNQQSSATNQGLRLFSRLPLGAFTPVQIGPSFEITAITDSTNNQIVTIAPSAGPAAPPIITTAGNHGLSTGNVVILSGLGANYTGLQGTWTITVTGATTFTIPSAVVPPNGASTGNVYKVTSTPVPITTATAHGLVTGDTVIIKGSNTTPSIDGQWVVTVTNSTVFTIPSGVVTTPSVSGTIASGNANIGTGQVYKVNAYQTYGFGTTDGTNWGLYGCPNPSGIGSLTLVGGSTTTLGAGFHDIELTVDQSSSQDTAVRLTIDGAPYGGAFTGFVVAPQEWVLQAVAVANGSAATETLDVDTFSIDDGYLGTGASISSYAYIYSWAAAPNATGGYLLKYMTSESGVWNSIDVGAATTYTLTTVLPSGATLNSPPPTGLPSLIPTAVLATAGLQGSSLPAVTSQTAVNCVLGGGRWEWLDLGELDLGPLIPRWQTQPAPWYVGIQAANSTGGTLAVDQIAVLDARLPRQTVTQLNQTVQGVWDSDTRPDNEVGVGLLGATVTPNGGEITDVTRTTNTEGDGLATPSGYGLWAATTNLEPNGGFETNTTGWILSVRAARSTGAAKFGTACLNYDSSGGAQTEFIANDNASRATGNGTQKYTASCWAKLRSGTETGALQLRLSTADLVTTHGFISITTLTTSWQHFQVTATPANGTTIVAAFVANALQANVDIDGVQIEAQNYATPYKHTNGGTAARVQGLVNGTQTAARFTVAQGAFAARVIVGEATSGTGLQFDAFGWFADANNFYECGFDAVNNRWYFISKNGSGTSQVNVSAGPYSGGEHVTLVAYWTGSLLGLSVNGSAFTTVAQAHQPVGLGATFTLGTLTSSTNPFSGTVLWAAMMSGTPSNLDATALAGLADVNPPTFGAVTAGVTWIWPARTVQVMVQDSYAGRASASAPMMVGPGNTWLTVIPEVGDGSGNALADAQNAQVLVDVIVTPRYSLSQGT